MPIFAKPRSEKFGRAEVKPRIVQTHRHPYVAFRIELEGATAQAKIKPIPSGKTRDYLFHGLVGYKEEAISHRIPEAKRSAMRNPDSHFLN